MASSDQGMNVDVNLSPGIRLEQELIRSCTGGVQPWNSKQFIVIVADNDNNHNHLHTVTTMSGVAKTPEGPQGNKNTSHNEHHGEDTTKGMGNTTSEPPKPSEENLSHGNEHIMTMTNEYRQACIWTREQVIAESI